MSLYFPKTKTPIIIKIRINPVILGCGQVTIRKREENRKGERKKKVMTTTTTTMTVSVVDVSGVVGCCRRRRCCCCCGRSGQGRRRPIYWSRTTTPPVSDLLLFYLNVVDGYTGWSHITPSTCPNRYRWETWRGKKISIHISYAYFAECFQKITKMTWKIPNKNSCLNKKYYRLISRKWTYFFSPACEVNSHESWRKASLSK